MWADNEALLRRKKIKEAIMLRRLQDVNIEEIEKARKRQLELRRLYQGGEVTSKFAILPQEDKKKEVSKYKKKIDLF